MSLTVDVETERTVVTGIGFPEILPAPTTPLGWPGGDVRASVSRETEETTVIDTDVSRETSASEPEGAPARPGGAPERAHAASPKGTHVPSDHHTDDEFSATDSASGETADEDHARSADPSLTGDSVETSVSRETPLDGRAALVAALPRGDDDSPLAQAVADDARKRITLSGRNFPTPARTRVLTVANQKGGVGKTTTTVNVAAALAQAGARVLVIDLDPQGNASTALGIDHHAEIPSIYDVLVDGTPLADVVQECPDVDGLYCAPATIDLAGAEIELVSLVARETRLAKAVQAHLESQSDGAGIDYVFVDCPPSLGLLTINAFVAAQEVFIPIQCEYYALEGLSQLLKNIELIKKHLNPQLHVSSILLTMFDGRTRLASQVADEVRNHFPDQTFRAAVPRSVRISEAPSHGQTVMTYDPNSSGALSYLEAAAEMAERGARTSKEHA